MLSKETCKKIKNMVQSDAIGDEVILRISSLQETPKTMVEAKQILNSFDVTLSDEIIRIFKTRMSNYDHGESGNEIANGLNGVVEVLKAAIENKPLEALKKDLDGEMDKISFEALAISIASVDCSKNFKIAYNKMINSVCSIGPLEEGTVEKIQEMKIEEPLEIVPVLAEQIQERKIIKKRIYFK